MKLFISSIVAVALLFMFNNVVFAQSANGSEDPRHNELRAILADLQKALGDKDIPKIKSYLHPNVNVIYQNGEVADGVDAVEAFYKRMLTGDNPLLKNYSASVAVDQLSEFYGDTAVAYGSVIDSLSFADGQEIKLPSKWTATLVKENGQWKIVSLQFGVNVFDNPVLSAAKKSIIYFSFGGAAVGLILGLIITRFRKKGKTA